jgi:hypothetical protein
MKPYSDSGLNQLYDLLFCDDLDAYKSNTENRDAYPWSAVWDTNATSADLRKITDDWNLETRPKILAANLLLNRGQPLPGKRIFAVIVEVAMDEGLDVLAAYEDGTARYINYSGKLIVWDATTSESNELVVDLFLAARKLVEKIGPWEQERLPPPPNGNTRISFLVSDGLYFGEGPFNAIASDQLGGPVINRAGKLMNYLVNTTMAQSR